MAKLVELDRRQTRGSRRHVLDWVSDRDRFLTGASQLISATGATMGDDPPWMPHGWADAREARLERWVECGKAGLTVIVRSLPITRV